MLHVVVVILQMTFLATVTGGHSEQGEGEELQKEGEEERKHFLIGHHWRVSAFTFSLFSLSLFFHPLHPSGHTVAGAFYSRSVPRRCEFAVHFCVLSLGE